MLHLDIVRSPVAHARIKSIDAEKALAIPGVLAVITGKDLEQYNLAWMPTLMGDTQMVLPVDTVKFDGQEVAAVLATDRYTAADGVNAVDVEYEPIPVVVDPFKALEQDAPIVREDKEEKSNHIWHWEVGDRDSTDRTFRQSEVTVKEDIYIPRIHVSSIETCGCVAQWDPVQEKLTVWMTTQAPHAIRTVLALVAGHLGLAEHKIRVISPDIGGGFGGKVPVYPGYVLAIAASFLTGQPVKWVEDRMENLIADSFARDYHISAEVAARQDGTMEALRIKTVADHGYTDAAANPSKFPAGLFHICTGSYDFSDAFVEVDGVYTNKPPGGIAYRCSFPRHRSGVRGGADGGHRGTRPWHRPPPSFASRTSSRPDAFPYRSALGWEYDSGDYQGALEKAMDIIGYEDLRREQAEKREQGELMGVGISSFTEIVGAGPSRHFDILGIKMFDSADIRIHPTGKAIARFGTRSQGQGHETTYAQIIAEELGIPVSDIAVEEGDTDTAPYGLGTYASRSTPTAGAAGAIAARKIRDKARAIASYLLDVSEEDLEWEPGRFFVRGSPSLSKTIQEIAFAAYTDHPPGMEAGLEAHSSYDPPNLTYPFGSYICAVDIDKGTGEVKIRRFVAVDDCGNIINPMIVEGQVHGGLTMGLAPALYEEIVYDEKRSESDQHLHGLPAADSRGDSGMGNRQDLHAVSASPPRCQGDRRVGNCRCSRRNRKRCRGCPLASWGTQYRYSHYA